MSVVALVDDLMFLSRIREAARRQSVEVKAVRTAEALLEACRAGARVVIVDLDARRLPSAEALSALRADPGLAGLPTVGFFSHVEVERAREARESGCRTVLPRSAFVQRLDALLAAPSGDGREPGAGAQ
jgi:DNA-binding NarL/FixJ family response regulator